MVKTLNMLLAEFQFTSIENYLHLHLPRIALSRTATALAQAHTSPAAQHQPVPISLIVPCFNEEAGIRYLASSLHELAISLSDRYDVQFILIDDGSRDATWEMLTRFLSGRPDTLLLRHSQNRGVSAAIMTGLEHAHEIACSIDCDCSYDPVELKSMLPLLRENVDLVTASPYHPAGAVLNVPRWRLLLSRGSCFLYRLVTGSKLHTFTACMRVYRRSSTVGVPLQNEGFLGIAELASRLVLEGKHVVEHPATLEVRIFGQSSMKILRTIAGHLRLLTQLSYLRLSGRRSLHLVRPKRLHTQAVKATVIAPDLEP
jgi:hypothetical protein